MKIAMIGTGYVGLVSGVCFSDFGHDVVCVDKDPAKIAKLQSGEVPIFEPGLQALMAKNVAAGRLNFTLDLASAVVGADAVFIAVGTPTRRGDGHADLTYVMAAAAENFLKKYKYIIKTTSKYNRALIGFPYLKKLWICFAFCLSDVRLLAEALIEWAEKLY
jgi:nucleotide sugar dehydrogenase